MKGFVSGASGKLGSVVCAHLLEHDYQQSYPAQSLQVRGCTAARLVSEHSAHVPLRRPSAELEGLVDISEITRVTGWVPRHQVQVAFAV